LTTAQVISLIGRPVSPQGQEFDHSDNYRTCGWSHANAAISLAVFNKAAPGDPNFSNDPQAGTPRRVPGLGDSATIASATGNTQLLTNQGLLDVAMSVTGKDLRAGQKAAMIRYERKMLTQLSG
jgi:hypothetical protein